MLSTRDPPQNKGYIQTESEGLEKDSIYRGLVFVSIHPVFVFWLENLTHLHLRSLLISMIPLPFTLLFWVHFYKPFLCFLSRKDPLAFIEELVWWC